MTTAVHYQTAEGRAVCGTRGRGAAFAVGSGKPEQLGDVTCEECRADPAYRAAAEHHAAEMTSGWRGLLAVMERSPDPTDRMMRTEEDLYAALCEFVDQTGLTYGPLDPRGPDTAEDV